MLVDDKSSITYHKHTLRPWVWLLLQDCLREPSALHFFDLAISKSIYPFHVAFLFLKRHPRGKRLISKPCLAQVSSETDSKADSKAHVLRKCVFFRSTFSTVMRLERCISELR